MDNGHNLKLSAAELDAALARAQSISNPNLLDNWYFGNPVDQRGGYVVPPGATHYASTALDDAQVVTAYYKYTPAASDYGYIAVNGVQRVVLASNSVRGYTGTGYTIDRWKNYYPAGVVTITDKGVTLGAMKWLSHRFENNELYGKTLTASALFSDGEFCYGTAVYNGGESRFCYTVDYAVYLELVDNGGATAPEFRLVNYNETAEKTVVAVKLELGSQQTLAHQDENGNWVLNEIPNYNEELLKCIQSTADGSDTYANKTILHTGNKPSGSYTGNGDATSRTISVGGIGKCCVVYGGTDEMACVTPIGAFFQTDGNVKFTSDVTFDGALHIRNAYIINSASTTYNYQVL